MTEEEKKAYRKTQKKSLLRMQIKLESVAKSHIVSQRERNLILTAKKSLNKATSLWEEDEN
ncbi:MAG: hypothetical protein ACOCTT_03900 [archaeon]